MIKKLLSPLKKKPKKSKRTLLFFTFSFYSFEVTLFRIVFAFPLCCGCEHSLLLFFDSCNELLCSVFFATEGEEFFFPQYFLIFARSGYFVRIKRARSFAESFARKRERKDDDDDDDDELFDNDDDDDENDERFVDGEE